MDWQTFEASLANDAPPAALSRALQALWQDANGDWDTAHRLAQEEDDRDGAWVHAYLHRKEGDASNAAYWYRRAGRPVSRLPLNEEWREIAEALLAQG
jgi:hypothetical protein